MPDTYPCPVCGKNCFEKRGSFEICPECFWENDPVQEDDPFYIGGANIYSLNESRFIYRMKDILTENFISALKEKYGLSRDGFIRRLIEIYAAAYDVDVSEVSEMIYRK